MTKETRTQWHPAFCAAVRLELIENKEDLDYMNECNYSVGLCIYCTDRKKMIQGCKNPIAVGNFKWIFAS